MPSITNLGFHEHLQRYTATQAADETRKRNSPVRVIIFEINGKPWYQLPEAKPKIERGKFDIHQEVRGRIGPFNRPKDQEGCYPHAPPAAPTTDVCRPVVGLHQKRPTKTRHPLWLGKILES